METKWQLLRSNYIRTIAKFVKVYPPNQILICLYDAIKVSPGSLLNDVVNFITGQNTISICHLELNDVVNKSKANECPETM